MYKYQPGKNVKRIFDLLPKTGVAKLVSTGVANGSARLEYISMPSISIDIPARRLLLLPLDIDWKMITNLKS